MECVQPRFKQLPKHFTDTLHRGSPPRHFYETGGQYRVVRSPDEAIVREHAQFRGRLRSLAAVRPYLAERLSNPSRTSRVHATLQRIRV